MLRVKVTNFEIAVWLHLSQFVHWIYIYWDLRKVSKPLILQRAPEQLTVEVSRRPSTGYSPRATLHRSPVESRWLGGWRGCCSWREKLHSFIPPGLSSISREEEPKHRENRDKDRDRQLRQFEGFIILTFKKKKKLFYADKTGYNLRKIKI